ncbi:MAG TPA: pitrilysin family protein [Ignavibacteriaceae bacterium]|nr:pitrilysin family protein [Ignavibacteriaceae bacterium]
MLKRYLLLTIFLLSIPFYYAQQLENIDIPYKQYTLSNGLTLLVHEDHKAPIAAVNIWYHVGSKNEKSGKTGFAHLFEHLMFNGSENFNDDYFQALERVGATDLNGTTNEDRTNYFQNVPISALDLALFMESDRMGHLVGAITQGKLDEQRGVVQNEKRQGESQPYAKAYDLITENTYPKGHPYSWTVIGSMDDLAAAKLEDVHEWFKTYYGPNNAVLVVAGDVNPEDIKTRVEKYFGDIPPGPPISKYETYVAKMTGTKRMITEDRVPQSRLYMVWNVPEWGNEELTYLDLASDVLTSGKTSRLYKRLVYEEQIATDVNAYYSGNEIGSQFQIVATAKQDVGLDKIEKIINEELAKFLKEGPTSQELERIKTQHFSNFIRGIERIGGFGGKSDILAQSLVYGGNPEAYKKTLGYVKNATEDKIKDACNKWLSDGVFILEVHPYPQLSANTTGADRKKLPETKNPPDAQFPSVQKAELSNGLKIVLAQRNSIPVVDLNLMIDAGFAADQFTNPGTSSLMSNLMDEGTETKDALELSEELQLLGANLSTYAGLDYSNVYLSALKSNLDKSLELFADVTLNPSFPQKEIDRLIKERVAGIQREKVNPVNMALRVFPMFLFGKDHAYGNPLSGTGFENTVTKIKRDDLVEFHKTWFKPNNATLIVVGDVTMDEIKPKLEKLFKDWEKGSVPKKNISTVELQKKPVIYLVDKPQSQSSVVFAGHIAPPVDQKDDIEIQSMNNILGGSFTSRINMNLREDKHWSYGASSFIWGTKAQRPFLAYAFVQSDKTKESIQEMHKEISEFISKKKATDNELDKIKKSQILELPGSWETMGAIEGSLANMVMYNLPDDYYKTYVERVKDLNLKVIDQAALKVLKPENITWIVVGDRAKIENSLKELNYEIKYIDADGNITK